MPDDIDIGIGVHAEGAKIAEEVAAGIKKLREELDKLSKTNKTGKSDAKAMADALADQKRQQKLATDAQKEAAAATQKQTDAVKGLIGQVLALSAVFFGFREFRRFVDEGLKFNEVIETANLGVAALITSQTNMKASTGELVVGTDKLAVAQSLATDQVNKLRVAGLRSVATTQQLVVAFQQAVGIGLRWGLTLDQIRIVTVQVAQAAGALGVPLNQLNEEIRSLLTGTITPRNTRIATALGITNAQIKQAQQAGTLFAFVTKRLEAFSVAGEATARTFRGVMSNITEALQNLAGDATKPLFEALRLRGQEALEGMFDLNTARISNKLQGVLDISRDIFGVIGDFIGDALNTAVLKAQDFSKWLTDNDVKVRVVGSSLALAVGEAASLVREIIGMLLPLTEAGVKAGIFASIIQGAGLVIADLHTLLDAILTALGGIGVAVLNLIIKPFTFFLKLLARGLELFDHELAEKIRKVAVVGDEWLAGLGAGVGDFARNLEKGNTATERYLERVRALGPAAEAASAAQKELAQSLADTSEFETNLTVELDQELKGKVITQRQYADQVNKLQLIVVGRQLEAQRKYLASIAAENEGDKQRTRAVINELRKRESALGRNVSLTSASGPPEPKNTASKSAAGETALIKAELANRLKDLKIELDNERLSYHDYYASVTAAQQEAIDKQITVQKKLLAGTSDLGAREKITDQIKILGAQRLQVVEDNNEKERQSELKLTSDITAAHVQLLKDQGRLSEARALEIGNKYKKLIARLKKEGNQAGVDIVTALFSIDTAKVQVDEFAGQAKKILDGLSVSIAETDSLVKTHAITELQGREKIIDSYKLAKAGLDKLLPAMREAALLTGDPNQIIAVTNLEIRLREINTNISQLSDSFFKLKEGAKEAGTQGLASFIELTTEGAKDLKSIWIEVAASVVSSLRRIAAQMLANLIIQQALGLFGATFGAGGGGGEGIPVIAEAGLPVASGGYITGPGTGTSDSIPAWLSHGEYVVNADSVKKVGLDFLHAINDGGDAQVTPRRRLRGGYAEGGLVTAARGPGMGGFDATIGLDEGLVMKHLRSRQGTNAILNVIADNRKSVRSVLNT